MAQVENLVQPEKKRLFSEAAPSAPSSDEFSDIEDTGRFDLSEYLFSSTTGSSAETLVDDFSDTSSVIEVLYYDDPAINIATDAPPLLPVAQRGAMNSLSAASSRGNLVHHHNLHHNHHQQHQQQHAAMLGHHQLPQQTVAPPNMHISAAATHQQHHHNNGGLPLMRSGAAGSQHLAAMRAPQAAAFHPAVAFAVQNDQRLMAQVRLPESPPETDSGPASAGSPSGSEASPYSPDFHHSGYLPNSVIVPNGPSTSVQVQPHVAQQQQQPGVILNVPGLFFSEMHPGTSRGQNMGGVGGEFYANQVVAPPSLQHNNNMAFVTSTVGQNGYQCSEPASRKRQRVDSQIVKPEPSSPPLVLSGNEENVAFDDDMHPSIKFFEHAKEAWNGVLDEEGKELVFSEALKMNVVADKGFNFIPSENAFVNQKKNHFQISVHLENYGLTPCLLVAKDGRQYPISHFELDFYGIKAEMPTSRIKINQSAAERKPQQYVPERIQRDSLTKVSVPRLHFGETTSNNMRKNNRPNPEQRYFHLVVSLNAVVVCGSNNNNKNTEEKFVVMAQKSERTIVRASNPGQFETPENEGQWQKGPNNSLCHSGPVGIGTDNPTSPLTVAGNIHLTGQITKPSDIRLKENIADIDQAEALERISKLRIVNYDFKDEAAAELGMSEECRKNKTGVIAQELADVYPEAVSDHGPYLTVDNEKLVYENIGATQMLHEMFHDTDWKVQRMRHYYALSFKKNNLKPPESMPASLAGSQYSVNTCGKQSTGLSNGYKPCCQEEKEKLTDEQQRLKKKKFNEKRYSDDDDDNLWQGHCRVLLMVLLSIAVLSMVGIFVIAGVQFFVGKIAKTVVTKIEYHHPDRAFPGQIVGIGNRTMKQKWPYGLPPALHKCNHLRCEKYCCGDLSYPLKMLADDKSDSDDSDMLRARALIRMADRVQSAGAGFGNISEHNEISRGDPKDAYTIVNGSLKITEPKIRLIGSDNLLLDSRYCMEDACDRSNVGNFTYFVPISSSMPHIATTIKFDVDFGDRVDLCQNETILRCFGTEYKMSEEDNERIYQTTDTTWQLPVGYFLSSFYTFRIGHSTGLCSMPTDESGASFIEYTIWFYRLCK